MNIKSMLIPGIALVAALNSLCYAEIYKYKDEQGNWQFSDKPPKGESSKVYIKYKKNEPSTKNESTTDDQSKSTDLKTLLFKKYNPGNSIEKASLATVTVETQLGIGSGFFVSNDGYIITNKHVVRPTASGSWQETNTKFVEQKKHYDKTKKLFAEEENILKDMYTELKKREKIIDNEVILARRDDMQANYNIRKDEYLEREKYYRKKKTEFDKRKSAFDKERSNFNIKSSIANVTKTFKIILKNEKILSARLVAVSKEHDLALLKLDRHITPYIKTNKLRVHQTMVVYAVGSPLGIRDSVTSGIVTGFKKGFVLTDSKILPGNSGGPLLNKDGAAIGVNTARVSEFVSSEGLGIAIPMAVAHKEFAKFILAH